MIISHRYRFIFLKTTRVGGTSVEAAISQILEPGDVWTPVASETKGHHRAPEGSGYSIPLEWRERYWWLRRLGWNIRPLRRKILQRKLAQYSGTDYWPHIRARHVRATLPPEIWNGYYKVSIERNPWDWLASYYYYRYPTDDGRPPFAEVAGKVVRRRQNREIYMIDGEVVVDKLMRFETLAADFRAFLAQVGAPAALELPTTNASRRGDGRDYRRLYDDTLRELVAATHQPEIAYCGYTF